MDSLVFENRRIYTEVYSPQECSAIAYSVLGRPAEVVDYSFGIANKGAGILVVKTHNAYTATYVHQGQKVITRISYVPSN